MRVGLVAGEYPPMQGGVGAFTREVARAMISQGHEVQLITRKQIQSGDDGIQIAPWIGERWGWNSLPLIAKWIAESGIDILNIQFQTAAFDMHPSIHFLPSVRRSTPTVVTFHDLRAPYLFPKAGPVRERIVRKLARDADGVIATDRADVKTLSEDWHVSAVSWIPIGSNISTLLPPDYDRDECRRTFGVTLNDLLISYFGFLNESKGGLVLIDALAKLVAEGVPAHLIMIGGSAGSSDPTNLAYGQRVDAAIEAAELQERVHWTGFVDDQAVTGCFLASDITALPYQDGVSLRRGTLMAALAHRRAIVTTHPETDAPELAGAVETIPANNPNALAVAIQHLWQNPSRRLELEQSARRAAQNFTWDTIARNTIDFYECVLAK